MMGEIAIKAETSMSEPPAPQNNAITRNRMSGVLSFPRQQGFQVSQSGQDARVRGRRRASIGPFRVEKGHMWNSAKRKGG
jgi:hypothetical protein